MRIHKHNVLSLPNLFFSQKLLKMCSRKNQVEHNLHNKGVTFTFIALECTNFRLEDFKRKSKHTFNGKCNHGQMAWTNQSTSKEIEVWEKENCTAQDRVTSDHPLPRTQYTKSKHKKMQPMPTIHVRTGRNNAGAKCTYHSSFSPWDERRKALTCMISTLVYIV